MRATARDYWRAWGEATLSTLDHLLGLTIGLGLPAMAAGAIGYMTLGHHPNEQEWLGYRLIVDVLVMPGALAAALWMSRPASFFSPSMAEVWATLRASSWRLVVGALVFGVLLRLPFIFIFPGVFLAAIILSLSRPTRWLEGQGRLWGGGAGG